ncbi:hypothetical protein ACIBG7_43010 [Nonomuraea sp. NPDC050328]|uniref:hypothetical protein n=1 Tax=Nonomuraea sp. NPDC050328 TaxID=3364361 RepID=UPI0037A21059
MIALFEAHQLADVLTRAAPEIAKLDCTRVTRVAIEHIMRDVAGDWALSQAALAAMAAHLDKVGGDSAWVVSCSGSIARGEAVRQMRATARGLAVAR